MPNHPNRSKGAKAPSANPCKEEVRAAREAAGLTQTAAATLVHATCRSWQHWEAGDRRMHPGVWELFRIKSGALASGESSDTQPEPVEDDLSDAVKTSWDRFEAAMEASEIEQQTIDDLQDALKRARAEAARWKEKAARSALRHLKALKNRA